MSITELTDLLVEIEIPIKFSHFRYVQTIGRGASSVVILARDDRTQELVAAKFVSRAQLVSENKFRYFERELRILESLKHPNIVEHKETIYLPTVIVVVTEYCAGGDLFDFCSQRVHQSISQIRSMFYQIVRAIDYLHSKGYGHRDLKPENIFLDGQLHVKIGDLGLTKDVRRNALTSTICGTLVYSAPEVVAGMNYDPMRADMWSLGVLLFAFVMGVLPWRSGDAKTVEAEILRGQVEIPPHMPAGIAEIVEACCVKEPSARATAQEVLKMAWLAPERPAYERTFNVAPKQSHSLPPIRDPGQISMGLQRKGIPKVGTLKQVIHQPIRAVRSEKISHGVAMSQSRFIFKTPPESKF